MFAYVRVYSGFWILDFQFDYFQGNTVVGHADRNTRTKFGEYPTYVQKLLTKLFSIGFACKVSQNWVFWPI